MYLFLFCLWLVLNGRITLEIILLGMAVTALMALVLRGLFEYTPKSELLLWRLLPHLVIYLFILIKEIIKANISVLWAVLNPKRPLKQALVVFDVGLKHRFTRYLLANSITLTPGTITVREQDGRYTVHCLSREMIDGIESGPFVRALERMERLYDK